MKERRTIIETITKRTKLGTYYKGRGVMNEIIQRSIKVKRQSGGNNNGDDR